MAAVRFTPSRRKGQAARKAPLFLVREAVQVCSSIGRLWIRGGRHGHVFMFRTHAEAMATPLRLLERRSSI
jgi:hypothetical protein